MEKFQWKCENCGQVKEARCDYCGTPACSFPKGSCAVCGEHICQDDGYGNRIPYQHSCKDIAQEFANAMIEGIKESAEAGDSIALFASYVEDILNGKDTGEGVGVSPWEPTRRKLLKLCAQKSALMEAIEPFATSPLAYVPNDTTAHKVGANQLFENYQRAARVYEQVKKDSL